jgi:hypothetical protein
MDAGTQDLVRLGNRWICELGERKAGLHARVLVQRPDWRQPGTQLPDRGKCLADSAKVSNLAGWTRRSRFG